MLRLITCQHATMLLEQRADAPLEPTDRRSLWLHLRLCPLCQRYSIQTVLVAQLARAAAAPRSTAPGLSVAARRRIATVLPGPGK